MNNNQINRRDFLKLSSLASAAIAVKPLSNLESSSGQLKPHIIVFVYVAWAALNTTIYGYPRNTTPNLEKFAQNSVVYHRHYSPANFTVPGTASLFIHGNTGLLNSAEGSPANFRKNKYLMLWRASILMWDLLKINLLINFYSRLAMSLKNTFQIMNLI